MHEVVDSMRPLLQERRTVVASADRVLITGLVHVFKGVGPLVGATTTEAEALSCLRQNAADLLVCSDQLDAGGQGASLVAKAKQQQPQLRCLMLIRRPLLSTIEAAIAAGCDGLCSHERVGNGGLLSVLRRMSTAGGFMLIAAKRAPAAALRMLGTCCRLAMVRTSIEVSGGVRESSAM